MVNLYFRKSYPIRFRYVSFLSRFKINSTNWSAPNVWVFIAQLVELFSPNAKAMGSTPVKAPKFFRVYLQLL